MSRFLLTATVLFMAALHVFSAEWKEDYDEYTITPSDIPADAPRFEDYPAKPYAGPNAAPDLRSHPKSRLYRTRLKAWAKEKPSFAGHFILAKWGCGTECTEIAIIDAQSGKIFHPDGATWNYARNVDSALLAPSDIFQRYHSSGAIWHRADSRLLVLIGAPEGRIENRGISYYLWEGSRLKRIRFIPKPRI